MKYTTLKTFVACVSLLIAGACAQPENPQNEQLYHLVVDRPIICEKGPDCKLKWAKAVQWVHQRTIIYTQDGRPINYSLSKLSSNVIEAKFSVGKMRILRLPRVDGRFDIDFTFDCDRSDECYRKISRPLRMNFVNTLIGLPPGVTQTSSISYSVAPGILPPVNAR